MKFKEVFELTQKIYKEFRTVMVFSAISGDSHYALDPDVLGGITIRGTRVQNGEGVQFCSSYTSMREVPKALRKEFDSLDWRLNKPTEAILAVDEALLEHQNTHKYLKIRLAGGYFPRTNFLEQAFCAARELSKISSDTQYITNKENALAKKYFIPYLEIREYEDCCDYTCYLWDGTTAENIGEIQVDWSNPKDPKLTAFNEKCQEVLKLLNWEVLDGSTVRWNTSWSLNY